MQKSLVLFKCLFFLVSSWTRLQRKSSAGLRQGCLQLKGALLRGKRRLLSPRGWRLARTAARAFQKVLNLDQQKNPKPDAVEQNLRMWKIVLLYTATLIIMSTSEFVIEVYIMPEKFNCCFPLSPHSKHVLVTAAVISFCELPFPMGGNSCWLS